MKYNKEYIEIKIALINSIMLDVSSEVLDVSYSVQDKRVLLQFVLLTNAEIPQDVKRNVEKRLEAYEVFLKVIHIPKDIFNKNKENWRPIEYQWLDNLLYSKFEIL